ncbi:MAG: hypothetical protein NTW65_04150 [Deltaproteobacteria bacterium]|nr:hypothetical protein [Deltaproteobacteria bacterium]
MAPIVVLLIFAFVFFSIGPFGSFPLNDDWAYALAALKTSENIMIPHLAWTIPQSPWAIPQIILSAIWIKILGFSHFNLRILTFLIASAGLWGFDRILLLQNVNRYTRILAALCLIGFSPFLPLSASSMSDIYFFTLWIYACLTFELAFRTDKDKIWIIGFLLILLCSLERLFGIVIAIAVLIYSCFLKSTSFRKLVLFTVCSLSIIGIIVVIWNHFPSPLKEPLLQYPSIKQRVGNFFCVFLYLGVGVLPFALASLNWKVKKFPYGLIVVFFLFILGTWLIAPWNFRTNISGGTMPFFGNLLSRYGFFMQDEVLNGFREAMFGEWFWKLYTLISIIGAVFILGELWRSKQNWLKNWSFTGIASLLYLAIIITTRNPFFDRYLLPAFAGLLLYLATSLPTPLFKINRICSITGALCLIFFSTLVTQDYFRWNEAKWTAANWAVAQGYSPLTIDGGFEWNGWHHFNNTKQNENQFPAKIIISFSELNGTSALKEFSYESWVRKGSIYCLLIK